MSVGNKAPEIKKGEHFDCAVEATACSGMGERGGPACVHHGVLPFRGLVSRCEEGTLHTICEKPAGHHDNGKPKRNKPFHGEVHPEGVFDNSVSDGIKGCTER